MTKKIYLQTLKSALGRSILDYSRREFITNIGFHMPIAFIWKSGESPAQWCIGQLIVHIQNSVKHLGTIFGGNS